MSTSTAVQEVVATPPPKETVYDILKKPGTLSQIKAALPKILTAERFIRVATTTLRKSPDIWDADPMSIIGCIIQAAGLGLEIDSTMGHCYMVPFKNRKNGGRLEAQLIVGYKGYLALAHRSGQVTHFSAHVVYKNDEFSFENGSHAYIKHVPFLDGDRGPERCVFAVLRTIHGAGDHEVIAWPKIIQFQKQYAKKGRDGSLFGPWVDHLEEMARKTLIRALAKRAPLSAEMSTAVALDERHDAEQPQNLAALVEMSAGDRVLTRVAPQGMPEVVPDELPAEGD